jgi:hypothetical protein
MPTSSPRPDRALAGAPAAAPPSSAAAAARAGTPTEHAAATAGGRRWVLGVVLGLMLIVLVNFVFIYIAVSDADQIVPSYQLEHR